MTDGKTEGSDSTEALIETLHATRKKRSVLINPDYLDDEKLPGDERTAVLKEIFNRNIREKQLSRIISHLSPILDSAHPPSALIYGPTGSGKTVSLIHVLSTFRKVAKRHGVSFEYRYIDLTSPKTYFGALNEVAIALDSREEKIPDPITHFPPPGPLFPSHAVFRNSKRSSPLTSPGISPVLALSSKPSRNGIPVCVGTKLAGGTRTSLRAGESSRNWSERFSSGNTKPRRSLSAFQTVDWPSSLKQSPVIGSRTVQRVPDGMEGNRTRT